MGVSIPDLLKLLTCIYNADCRNTVDAQFTSFKKAVITDEQGVILCEKEEYFCKLDYLIGELFREAFKDECQSAHTIGSLAGPVIVMCFGDVAAAGGVISELNVVSQSAKALTQFLKFCEKFADVSRYFSEFGRASIKIVKGAQLSPHLEAGGIPLIEKVGEKFLVKQLDNAGNIVSKK